MRTPSLLVIAFIALASACSRQKKPDPGPVDLVLGDASSREPVVSAIELAGEAKSTPAAPSRSGPVAAVHAHRRARTRNVAPTPRRARGVERAPVVLGEPRPTVAAAPVPTAPPRTAPAPTPASDPAPSEPAGARPGRGSGGWQEPGEGGGIHLPGILGGGVIIIRGGHTGADPCDEHGRGGVGGGFPGRIGRGGRGFPGGIVFLRGH